MANNHTQVNLRLPTDLLDAVRAAAEKANRSMTAEFTYRLQQSFSANAGPQDDSTTDILLAHEKFLLAKIKKFADALQNQGFDEATLEALRAELDGMLA